MRTGIKVKIAAKSFFLAKLTVKQNSYVFSESKFASVLFATENSKNKQEEDNHKLRPKMIKYTTF